MAKEERRQMGLDKHPFERFAFLGCALAAAIVAFYFHNKFWWGPDEGFYAYISDRILKGDVVHKDIQALHPGLLFYINALFLKLANGDPVGLRYPLILITIVQTCLAFLLVRKFGILHAIAASSAMIAFSFVQFINPTPNWYLITICLSIAYILETRDTSTTRTLILVGMLVGIGFLMRQLTGVFLAMGVTTVLFLRHSNSPTNGKFYAGSVVLLLLALSLTAFIFSSVNIIGLLGFGMFPPLILLLAARKANLSLSTATSIIMYLSLGAFLAALPLVIYHITTGSFVSFLYNSLIAPFGFHELSHVEKSSYASLIYFPVSAIAEGNLSGFGGLFFWVTLLSINAVLAFVTIKTLVGKPNQISALGILVLFHSLVALIYEIPIYLTYTTGLILVALIASWNVKKGRNIFPIFVLLLSGFGLYFHAAQPLNRGIDKVALNQKIDWSPTQLANTKILTDKTSAKTYDDILDLIEKCTNVTDRIAAIPLNPGFYFLSQRPSAFVFVNSAYGLVSQDQVQTNLMEMQSNRQPALIFYKEDDKYNTPYSVELMREAISDYIKVGILHEYEVYQRQGHTRASMCIISSAQNDKA